MACRASGPNDRREIIVFIVFCDPGIHRIADPDLSTTKDASIGINCSQNDGEYVASERVHLGGPFKCVDPQDEFAVAGHAVGQRTESACHSDCHFEATEGRLLIIAGEHFRPLPSRTLALVRPLLAPGIGQSRILKADRAKCQMWGIR